MRQSYLILSNALVIWASRILVLVPQLILVPYLIGSIGEDKYGVYTLIWSLLMCIDQLEKSLQSGVVKYSAAYLAKGQIEKVNRIISSSFVYSLLLGIVAAAGIFFASLLEGPLEHLGFSLSLVALLVLLIIPLTPYIAIIQSRQCYYVGVVAETISKYLSLAIIYAWFTMAKPSVEALIVIMTAMLLFSRIVQVPIAYRLVPGMKNRPITFEWSSFRLIFAFGGMTVLIALCNIANTTGLRWLMGILVSTNFVAHLAIILMPGMLLTQILQAVTITVMPATSAYQATGNKLMLRELLIRSMRYTAIIVFSGVMVTSVLIKDVLDIWVGQEYRFLSPYTLINFISVAFLMISSSAHHMLKGLEKLRITIFNSLAGKVVLPAIYILLAFFITGDSYSAVTAGLALGNIVSGLLYLLFAMKFVDINYGEGFVRTFIQPLAAVVPVTIIVFALIFYSEIESFALKIGVVAIGTSIIFIQMYCIFATGEERRQARDIMNKVLKILREKSIIYKLKSKSI